MNLRNISSRLAAGIAAVALTTSLASAFSGQELVSKAKISIVRARALAHHAVAGTIVSEELEKEAGGSGLRYTFDIRGTKGVREVGIDAMTGRVLENTPDSAP